MLGETLFLKSSSQGCAWWLTFIIAATLTVEAGA
jgi:hypothetical protein